MFIRIIQGCLILSVMIMFIFMAILDQQYVKFGFYASLCMIVVFGLYCMMGTQEFIDHMNEKHRNK